MLKIRKENLLLRPKIIFPCLALGAATFVMQASESVISVCFNASLQSYGGRYGSKRDGDFDKCYAVCTASPSRPRTGCAADHQL